MQQIELKPPSIEASTASALTAQLGAHHRARVLAHLLALPDDDRRLRFGHLVKDDAIHRYARTIRYAADGVFGALDADARLLGLGHVALIAGTPLADFGISVLPEARRQGLGLRLLQRSAQWARNRGARTLVMSYLPENTRLARLAARAQMRFVHDQVEPAAYLDLEPPTGTSLMTETVAEMLAAVDLGFRIANADSARLTSA